MCFVIITQHDVYFRRKILAFQALISHNCKLWKPLKLKIKIMWSVYTAHSKFDVKRLIRFLYIFQVRASFSQIKFSMTTRKYVHIPEIIVHFWFPHWWGISLVSFRGFHSLQVCENGLEKQTAVVQPSRSLNLTIYRLGE